MNGYVGMPPGTSTLTLPDGSSIELADWIDDQLYSPVQFQNGDTAPAEAFSAGRGQQIPGGNRALTRVDTNTPRNGDTGLPTSWRMLIFAFGIKFVRVCRPQTGGTEPVLADGNGALSDPPILRTVFDIDRVVAFAYEYNQKIYTSGVLQDYPTGHGFSVFSTNPAFELANNGVPSPRDRRSIVLPVDMRANLGFKGLFQPEAPIVIAQAASDGNTVLNFCDVKLYLYGLIKRSVV